MKASTQLLLEKLKNTGDIAEYLEQNKYELLDETTGSYLTGLLEKRGLKIADVAEDSLRGEYVYKVFRDERKASREVLLSIAVGMKLSLAETQLLLRVARCAALDPRNRFDSVLLFVLEKGLSVDDANETLAAIGESNL